MSNCKAVMHLTFRPERRKFILYTILQRQNSLLPALFEKSYIKKANLEESSRPTYYVASLLKIDYCQNFRNENGR